MWDAAYPYLAALLPTVGISLLFYVVIRNLLAADRSERKAQAEWEANRTATGQPFPNARNDRRIVGHEGPDTNEGDGASLHQQRSTPDDEPGEQKRG